MESINKCSKLVGTVYNNAKNRSSRFHPTYAYAHPDEANFLNSNMSKYERGCCFSPSVSVFVFL